MENLDMEGFLSANKMLLISILVVIILVIAAIFGFRYYSYKTNASANALLWKGINLYMSNNGKNQDSLNGSISALNKLQKNYGGTYASKVSNFYIGMVYIKLGNFKQATVSLKKYTKLFPKPGPDNLTFLAYSNLAAISLSSKDYAGALRYFSAMAKIDDVKLQEYALLEKASLYSQMKMPKKAIDVYKKILTEDAVTGDRGYIENLIQLNMKMEK